LANAIAEDRLSAKHSRKGSKYFFSIMFCLSPIVAQEKAYFSEAYRNATKHTVKQHEATA
jgi:hypothetical protein